MAQIPRILKNFSLFVDGRGLAGVVSSLTIPKLTTQMEEFRGGGMDAPVELDMGMEKLEASFELFDYDENIIRLYGLADGASTQVTARGALRRDGEAAVAMIVNMTGVLKELDPGDWKAGSQTSAKFSVALRYLKITIGGTVIAEIDKVNMIRKINGVDQLATIRTAIGV
jgi:P2 family phage contractile tail tube protein